MPIELPSDASVVGCITKAECPTPPVPSQGAWCFFCAEALWISNTLASLQAKRKLIPVCLTCAQGLMATEKQVEFEILPEQEAELAAAGVLPEVKEGVRRFNLLRRKR